MCINLKYIKCKKKKKKSEILIRLCFIKEWYELINEF